MREERFLQLDECISHGSRQSFFYKFHLIDFRLYVIIVNNVM